MKCGSDKRGADGIEEISVAGQRDVRLYRRGKNDSGYAADQRTQKVNEAGGASDLDSGVPGNSGLRADGDDLAAKPRTLYQQEESNDADSHDAEGNRYSPEASTPDLHETAR